MRIWLKVYGNAPSPFNQKIPGASGTWVCVQTAPNGDNSYVMLAALMCVLRLNLNESPFFASAGVPIQQALQQQAPPDYYIAVIQQQYAQFFAALTVRRTSANPPTYQINVTFLSGATLSLTA